MIKRSNSHIQKSFQKLKTWIIHNKGEFIQKLKPETRKKIAEVVKLESCIKYRLTRHIMNRLDIFCRFWFPIVYLIWLNFMLLSLEHNYIRFTVFSVLISAVVASYVVMKIKETKQTHKITTWQSIKYYMKGKCWKLDKTVKFT